MRCGSIPRSRGNSSYGWKLWEIIAMVAGFIVFWPLGLGMIVYKKIGHRRSATGAEMPFLPFGPLSRDTRNVAFDAYKADEIRRLAEERQQLVAEQWAFEDFLGDLKRAKDREEFDAFMARRRAQRGSGG